MQTHTLAITQDNQNSMNIQLNMNKDKCCQDGCESSVYAATIRGNKKTSSYCEDHLYNETTANSGIMGALTKTIQFVKKRRKPPVNVQNILNTTRSIKDIFKQGHFVNPETEKQAQNHKMVSDSFDQVEVEHEEIQFVSHEEPVIILHDQPSVKSNNRKNERNRPGQGLYRNRSRRTA